VFHGGIRIRREEGRKEKPNNKPNNTTMRTRGKQKRRNKNNFLLKLSADMMEWNLQQRVRGESVVERCPLFYYIL